MLPVAVLVFVFVVVVYYIYICVVVVLYLLFAAQLNLALFTVADTFVSLGLIASRCLA